MIWMKRDNREAKEARIASLQAWFERCDILILDSIPHKEELVLELTRFPKYKRNDIIDALADQLHERESLDYEGNQSPRHWS
jgi:phage terminase large subunit-like protein